MLFVDKENKCLDNTAENPPQDQLQKVLVVEDEEMNRVMFVEMISSLGFEADSAGNGAEALQMLAQSNYGLVITDLQMPHMDGLELAQALYMQQSEARRPPIVMMTGTIPTEHEKRVFYDKGVSEFVGKPVSLATLRTVLQKYFSDGDAENPGGHAVKRKDADLPVDLSVLEGLVGNDPAIHAFLLQKFANSLTDILIDMHKAVANKSSEKICALSHKLKSPSKSMGAERLAQISIELEKAGEREDWDTIQYWLPELVEEAETVSQFIRNL